MPEKQTHYHAASRSLSDGSHYHDEERRRQIRELIVSPLWNCLSLEQRERWLDQFQDLTQ